MKTKAIAIAMAMTMALVGCVAMVSEDSQATTSLGDVDIAVNETVNLQLAINEGNYTQYTYEIEWSVNSTPTWTSTSAGLGGTTNSKYTHTNYEMTLTRSTGQELGKYTLGIKGLKVTSDDQPYTIAAKVTVTVGEVQKVVGTVDYTGNVKVHAAAGGEMAVSDITGFTEGLYSSVQVSATYNGSGVPSTYDWYAVDLPAGLSMSSDGLITGIPTAPIEQDTIYSNVKIYATDEYGNVLYDTDVNLTVKNNTNTVAESKGFSYSVNGTADESAYVFYTSEAAISLSITDNNDSEAASGAVVKVLAADGFSYSQTYNGAAITLPNSGTGSYRVSITYEGLTQSFTVHVLAPATSIAPGIIIVGS